MMEESGTSEDVKDKRQNLVEDKVLDGVGW